MDHGDDDSTGAATGGRCGSCGTRLSATAKFCSECGAPVASAAGSAEYKQVTVLFADVVHSMDIAATVGPERLREIMAELADMCAAIVKRFGGTVDKFTGDGIMAVFGAPAALEDHAARACLAALHTQEQVLVLAAEVGRRDGIELRLRIGLNSGQVIAGEIGSGPFGYTTVGEQVGMAQRMESVAAPGGVMLGESTARLVDGMAVVGPSELVAIKGADKSVPARRLLGMASHGELAEPAPATLVGRDLEFNTIAGLLDRSLSGRGCVVNLAGPAGIGKTRLVREVLRLAKRRGVEVFPTFCESHATDIPFAAVAQLVRAAVGLSGLDDEKARARIRALAHDGHEDDLLLLHDLLGIRDPEVALPNVEPDARRRRLTAVINSMTLARSEPAVYVIEDVHWIDDVSESMFADLLAVIPRTHSTALITYRPEYVGALTRVPGVQTISLVPLSDSESAELLGQLLGDDPSVATIRTVIGERAAGNPFFVQEIVRELAERGVLEGDRGAFICQTDVDEVSVPATLQAAIAARIDRLDAAAKRTLNAAAVVGSRFSVDLLRTLRVEPVVDDLVSAELVDQIRYTPYAEYAFRHPLVRTVAYESQLKSDRAELHKRVADTIDHQDQNAALVAEHLEAAGDLHGAFEWHMRAGMWLYLRNVTAAYASWRRAVQVADRLPEEDPARASMRIAPRTLLVGTAWRLVGSDLDAGFDELRSLCLAAGDQRSLAIGMAGHVNTMTLNDEDAREVSRAADEVIDLLASIDDPTLTVMCMYAPLIAKQFTCCETREIRRLAQLMIDVAGGDATKGNLVAGSPLSFGIVMRGVTRYSLGEAGWRDDLQSGLAMATGVGDRMAMVGVMNWVYAEPIMNGVTLADATAARETAEMLSATEQSGDDFQIVLARYIRGIVLIHGEEPGRDAGLQLMTDLRAAARGAQFPNPGLIPILDTYIAREMSHLGDVDAAVELSRDTAAGLFAKERFGWHGIATAVLVEALLRRGRSSDLDEARAAIDRLVAVPIDSGFVLHEVWLLRLRAWLAKANGDQSAYRDYRDRYQAMATSLGFEGHMQWAEEMP
jgi:adenylate cyclase